MKTKSLSFYGSSVCTTYMFKTIGMEFKIQLKLKLGQQPSTLSTQTFMLVAM